MILAFDTFYKDDAAKTIGILFRDWSDEHPAEVLTDIMSPVAAYVPGAFYKRELPCILQLLQQADPDTIEIIIIDGYVVLDDAGTLGLGGHLYEQLQQRIPVIGVAKTRFANNNIHVAEVLRGESKNPLFITAAGIDLAVAAQHIKDMYGEYRMPALLKQLDGLTRG